MKQKPVVFFPRPCTVLCFLMISSFFSFAQDTESIDSLTHEMCKTLKKTKSEPDSVRIREIYRSHLLPYVNKLKGEKTNEVLDAVYFRLQHNCTEFSDILIRKYPPKGDWIVLKEKPKGKMTAKECLGFLKEDKFWYKEANGDMVVVEIEENRWIGRFKDETYSKLKFKWMDDCSFELEFVESNNLSRKNFSKKGDVYRYHLIEKTKDYYVFVVEVP